MALGTAAAILGSAVIVAGASALGASKAAKASQSATDATIAANEKALETQQANTAVARATGDKSLNQLADRIGLNAGPAPKAGDPNWSAYIAAHPDLQAAIAKNSFNGATPEALVQGRERIFFEHFWNNFAADKNRSIPEAARKSYAAAYARPGRLRAGWAYFVSFQKAATDFAELSRTKLKMPVLVIGGQKSLGTVLAQQMKLVAVNVSVVVLSDTGHWVLEERPKETVDALTKFL